MAKLDYKLMKNHSTLKFRIMLSQNTTKVARYPYEKVLSDYVVNYMKKNHPTCTSFRTIRFHEVYDNYGIRYLQIIVPIRNHRGWEKIIEVEY